MENIYSFTLQDFQIFLLAFFRVTGVIMFSPLFGSQNIPPLLKIMLSLTLAAILFPVVRTAGVYIPENMLLYIIAVAKEMAVGFVIGFGATMLFTAVQFGGQIIDQELGLGLANVIDPISNEQVSIMGQFKLTLAMIIYLILDGHHFILNSVVQSFSSIPLLSPTFSPMLGLKLSDAMVGAVFVSAIKIAAPALVTLFLINIALAFMARTAPEINVFVVGFTVRLVLGLLVVAIGVELFGYIFEKLHLSSVKSVGELVSLMGS
ncbi:flagellar biosynthetic protein FliR [Candidatus Peregrinibacteria bacterium]|nr:flagellar biosynthetic protein FliR [Candidatus Peregrinibacteria bacterium]